MARSVHDSIDAFSSAEERTQACGLLSSLIDKVDFGRDVERTLETLSLIRQSLSNLDEVKVVLTDRYLALGALRPPTAAAAASAATAAAAAAPTPKLAAFRRAVFSAAAVTIPSIDDPLARLKCYTRAAAGALAAGALNHADAFFRGAIGEIPDLPAQRAIAAAANPALERGGGGGGGGGGRAATSDALQLDLSVASQIGAIAHAALGMPGHPELGGTYLARGLLNAVTKYPWSPSPPLSPARPRATLALLPLLQGWLEDPPPYAPIPGVDSNAVLYAGDGEYHASVAALHRSVLETACAQVGEAAEGGDKGVALDVLLELLEAPFLRRALGCDPGCRDCLLRAAQIMRGLAPAHPLLAEALAVLKG